MRLASLSELRARLARSSGCERGQPVAVSADLDIRIVYEAKVDRSAEIARLKKEIERLAKRHRIEAKARLADESFRSKAPAKIVRDMEATLAERQSGISKASRTAQTDRISYSAVSHALSLGLAVGAPRTPCSRRTAVGYSASLTMAKKTTENMPGTTDQRIDALLTLLAENSTIVISGAKIAKEIGVTRQQVWRWIEKLRALGVKVKGHPHTGYHIERVPDILAPQMLSHRLYGTPFARRIHHFFKVDSTNTVALRWPNRESRTAPWCWPRNKRAAEDAPADPGYPRSRRGFTARFCCGHRFRRRTRRC